MSDEIQFNVDVSRGYFSAHLTGSVGDEMARVLRRDRRENIGLADDIDIEVAEGIVYFDYLGHEPFKAANYLWVTIEHVVEDVIDLPELHPPNKPSWTSRSSSEAHDSGSRQRVCHRRELFTTKRPLNR